VITEQDLQAAIAECQGKRNPDANTCIKLAAFYTIKENLFPRAPEKLSSGTQEGYAYAPAPEAGPTLDVDGKSEFTEAVRGRRLEDVWPIIDELMLTLQVIQPRLYNAVMAKIGY